MFPLQRPAAAVAEGDSGTFAEALGDGLSAVGDAAGLAQAASRSRARAMGRIGLEV
jgi:hypothetical protein